MVKESESPELVSGGIRDSVLLLTYCSCSGQSIRRTILWALDHT